MIVRSYGWTMIDLFTLKSGLLKTGAFRLPLYKPPILLDIDKKDISFMSKKGESMLWLRVS